MARENRDVEGNVNVTFQRNNVGTMKPKDITEENKREKSDVLKQLTERQKGIVARLIETGQRNVLENVLETSASLSKKFKVNERTIRRDMSDLQKKGVIRRDGGDKGGRWIVIES